MDICVSCTNPTGCGHYNVTSTVGGATRTFVGLSANELSQPMADTEWEMFHKCLLRVLYAGGVPLSSFTGRILRGDEATNVKTYNFFGPGAAITKTNIGTSYVNICPGANGERLIADFTGCTQFRLMLHANLIGSGQWGARVVRDSDNAVLVEQANLGAAGERELDTNWQALPAAFLNQGIVALRAQAKSTTAGDDPVFRSLLVGLR